jgi:hypothetical protein
VARRLQLRAGVGERMLTSKLQVLNGTANRRTSLALRMLTGRIIEPLTLVPDVETLFNIGEGEAVKAPVLLADHRHGRHYAARTVYLSERHLRDVDRIIETWQQVDSKRLTRSAVLRRAIEHLRDAVEADPAKCTLEND